MKAETKISIVTYAAVLVLFFMLILLSFLSDGSNRNMKLGQRLNFVTHSHEDRRSNYPTN